MGTPLSEQRMRDFGPSGPTQCPFCFNDADGKDLRLEEYHYLNYKGKETSIKHEFHCIKCGKIIMSVVGRD